MHSEKYFTTAYVFRARGRPPSLQVVDKDADAVLDEIEATMLEARRAGG